VESCPTITGASADHRLALASGEIEAYARALAAELGVIAGAAGPRAPEHWVKAVAKDLAANKGASLVTAGAHQPANVHALAAAINAHLNNVGATVNYTEPLEQAGTQALQDLVAEMKAGKVSRLVMLGGNPLYTAPGDLDFASALRKVALRIHLGAYDDETSAVCHWHIAEAHALESWGDARAHDGTTSIQQPLIAPLYDGHTALEVVAALAGRSGASAHELLKEYWQAKAGSWDKILHDGWIEGSTAESKPVSAKLALGAAVKREGIEVNFRPDPCVWDGRYANNGWLQELPRPITKLTWSNAVLMAPALAAKLGVANEEVVSVKTATGAIEAPAWIVPGHAADSITIHLGYGRWRAGRIANGVGVNANIARRWAEPWIESGARIEKTGRRERMAVTQEHGSMEGRGLIRIAGVEEYQKDPAFAQRQNHGPKNVKELSMYQPYEYKGYSWGMTIDLNACTGCNACTIACQSENNIPIVGREEVIRGREMHWIRMDRYFEGDIDDPSIHHQPLACVHCDNAPCEVVCPVAATTHSSEGLNQMTYNRCVGTRYCANNCPYKARRFNFFLYGDWESKSLDAMRNPDVTVRSRGVMEKCTYCVQRINAARIEAEKEDRKIRDGEVVTACQSVCPAQAIVFGDQNDPNSKIARLKKDPRNYTLLDDLNVKPRTSYLAKLRNPNPAIEPAAAAAASGARGSAAGHGEEKKH
jgi:molybdopterin-containing oxidoreductase family iron-sulfur binding subunit